MSNGVLAFIRQEEPQFQDVPDDQLIEAVVRYEPDFLKDPTFRKQARSLFGQQANEAQSQEELRTDLSDSYNPLLSTALGRAATRGTANLGQSVISSGDIAASIMSKFGLPESPALTAVREAGRSFLQGGEAIPSEGPADISSAIDQGPAGVGAFALERGIGEQLPQMAGTVLTGSAGVAAGLSPKAASVIAILANTFPQEAGGAFQEIKQRTGKEAPFTASAVGAINAFLETVGDSKLIERMMGGDQLVGRSVGELLKRFATRTAIQGGKEAGTEAAQELVTALAPETQGAERQPGLLPRVLGAGGLGLVGGVAFGGGTDIGQVASDVAPTLLPERRGPLTPAQRQFLQPAQEELRYSESLPIRPGQIGFNTQPNVAAPGEAPPLPVTQLPIRSEIPSSITPSELVDSGFGVARPELPRPNFDQPLIDAGIQLEPTLASQAAAARVSNQQDAAAADEEARRAGLTRQQLVAQELLQRIEADRQQTIVQAQQLEQAGRTDLANLHFATGLAQRTDQLLALGQRLSEPVPTISPTPNTDLGLQEAPPTTVAPSPVDAAILQQQLSAQPSSETAGLPPAPIQTQNKSSQTKSVSSDQLPDAQNATDTVWYHGTGSDITGPGGVSSTFSKIDSLFGSGFYLTDDQTIADSYQKNKNKGGVYAVRVNPRSVLNLELPMTPEVAAVIRESSYPQFRDVVDKGIREGWTTAKTFSELREAVSEESVGEMVPISEFVEMFSGMESNFRNLGIDAFTHIGGQRAGKGKHLHRVLILLDPSNEFGNATNPKTVTSISKIENGVAPTPVQSLPIEGGPNASTIRSDQTVIPQEGSVTKTGEDISGQNLQLPPQGQSESLGQRTTGESGNESRPAAAETLRQQGQTLTLTVTPSRAQAMEEMSALPQEEIDQASYQNSSGIPVGEPKTNAGRLLQEFLYAPNYIRSQAAIQGIQFDAEAEANMERRYQELAMDAYTKAQQRQLSLQQTLSRQQLFRGALRDTNRMNNTAGNLRDKVGSTEMETETGPITRPEVERATQDQTGEQDVRGQVLDFLDQFSTQSQKWAVANLLAKAMGYPTTPSKSARQTAFENDPALQARVNAFVQEVQPTRNSLGSIVGTPMSATDVTGVVNSILPNASQVKVVDDPTLQDAQGNPIRAQYRPGEAQPIVLNAAFLGSEEDVRRALYEELMHGVWNDPEVSSAWDRVKGDLTQQDLQAVGQYPAEVQQEEAAIRKVINEIEQGNQSPAVVRWIKAVVDAIKRLFGVDTTTDAQRILARALQARSGPGEIRNSLAQGLWSNTQEAREEATDAGNPQAILGSAAAQGSVIPQKYIDQLTAVPTTREERTTQRLLKPVADVATMGRDLVSSSAAVSPSAMLTVSGMPLAPADAQDIAAEAIVKQSLRLQALDKDIRAQQAETLDKLGDAVGREPEAKIHENNAELYRGVSDQLADDYRDYLKDQMLTLKRGAFNPETERQINDASRRVTEDYRGIGNAVAGGLRAIAKEIPQAALVSPEATRSWIESRLNDPTAARILSDSAKDWLLSPVGTGKSPLERDNRINVRLAAVKQLAEGNAQALSNLQAFQAAFNDKKVSPEAFAQRWNALRTKYKESLAAMREINQEVAKLDADYNGQEKALEILGQIRADPEHRAPVDQAIQHLQAGSTIRQYEVGKNGEYTGKIAYQNPADGKTVTIDLRPDVGTEAENLEKIRNLLADVRNWGASTDDRVAKAAWDKEADWLQRYATGLSPGIVTGTQIGGYRLPSFFQLQPFGREITLSRIDVRGPAYQRIGNRLVQGAHQAGVVYGQVDRLLREITEKHNFPIKNALVKAAQVHGRSGTREDVIGWYVPTILEPLVSQNQNPSSRPYQIGDFIDGQKITKEDFDAAKALKARDVELFAALQKAERNGANPILYYNPLQTAEEFAGKPLSRRSTDYGWKMPRRPESRQNERAKVFTENWINAKDGIERRNLLADPGNFGWVLMSNGLLTNTDKEFSPKLAPQDQALFRKIQDLQRTNSLPFTNFDELVSWAGKELATPTMPEAQAAAEFELRLLGYVDTFVRQFNRSMEIVPQDTAKLFDRLNVPRGTIDSVGVGDSPFIKPRGQLVAPPSFYRYTTADDQSWGSLLAGVRTVLNLREIEAITAAKAAIDRELQRFESKTDGEIVKTQQQLKTTGASRIAWNSAKRRVARSSRARAEAGNLSYDYLTLKNHQRTIDVLLRDMERLGREHVVTPEDNANVSAVREGRQLLTSSLLQSIVSVFNNVFGGTVANTNYRRGLGKWNFVSTPVEMLEGQAKYLAGNVISKARQIPGIDAGMKAMLATPGFKKLAEIMVGQQLQFERDRALAYAANTVDPKHSKENAAAAKLFPETAGRLIEDDPGPLVGLLNNIVSRIPGLARTLETSKNTFPGAFDRMINQVTTSLTQGWTNEISDATNRAWAMRDTGQPGWDDLTQPFNRFNHKDLGLKDETSVNFWRNMLAPAGSLESLSLEQYKRRKAGGDPALLTGGQLQSVAQEIARSTNMSDAANTPTLFQGRGVSGEVRKSLFMLLRYPINFAAVQENLAGKAYGDNTTSAKQWRMMSGAVAVILLLLLTSLGGEAGQEIREVATGDPRTRTSIGTILSDPNLADFAKYAGISASSVVPFFGEQLANLFGGTANKPALDATRMFAPLAVAMDLQQAAQRIYQTGDMTYPIADLARRYIPLSGAVINRALPGEVESRGATRALRLAAPSDMEIRQSGGGTGGRQTPQTPLIRDAVDAALAGNQAASKVALDKAVALQVAAGKTQKDAQKSVTQAFQSRDPERQVLGRMATDEERQRLLSRMSSSQRRAYLNSRSVFARPVRTKTRRLSTRLRSSSRRRARLQ